MIEEKSKVLEISTNKSKTFPIMYNSKLDQINYFKALSFLKIKDFIMKNCINSSCKNVYFIDFLHYNGKMIEATRNVSMNLETFNGIYMKSTLLLTLFIKKINIFQSTIFQIFCNFYIANIRSNVN